MMTMPRIAFWLLCLCSVLLVVGCESSGGPKGQTTRLTADDFVTMSEQMRRSILRCEEVQTSDYKLVIVIDKIRNESTTVLRRGLVLARLRALLNQNAMDRLQFVVRRAQYEQMVKERRDTDPELVPFDETADSRLKPDYALKGIFATHSRRNVAGKVRSDYWLCTFQLVKIEAGDIVWEDAYEVKRAGRGSKMFD